MRGSRRTSGRSRGWIPKDGRRKVVEAAQRGGRGHVGSIILGRGEDDKKVRQLAHDRRGGPGLHRLRRRPHHVLGPLTEWKEGRKSREAAVSEIARHYREWVNIFETAAGKKG